MQKITEGLTGLQVANIIYENDAINDSRLNRIGDFENVGNLTFNSVANGFWQGNIGEPPTTGGSLPWKRSASIPVVGGSRVVLNNYYASSESNTVLYALDASGIILTKLVSGADYGTYHFEIDLPPDAASILLNIYSGGTPSEAEAEILIGTATIKKSALSEIYSDLNNLIEATDPVTTEIEVTKNVTFGLNTGGFTPGSPFGSIYILRGEVKGVLKRVNFIASLAGTFELIKLTKDGLNYLTTVSTHTVSLGDNIIEINEPFTGKIGIRCITAKFKMVTVGGAGLSGISVTEGSPTPTHLAATSVEAYNLPTYDISAVIFAENTETENEVIARLDALENNLTGATDLVGVKWAALGDSITANSQGNTYANRIAAWVNASEYTNIAIGGATWAYRSGSTATPDPQASDDTNVIPNQVLKLVKAYEDNLIDKPELITISAGINDVSRGLALGNVLTEFAKPLNSVDLNNLTGAIRWSVSTLMLTFPDVRIILLTPLLTSVTARRYELTLPYSNKIKEVAARLAVPVIDCFGESLINEVNQSRYMQADLLHPNSTGQQMQALFVYRQLKNKYYKL